MNTKSISSSKPPLVSVVSICYNQEDYIAQALEGFLMQKTNFPFEVIIADDHSTDKTAQIVDDYAKRFPEIIKPVLRRENVGVQNNLVDVLCRAKGQYVALCEGDDFWTDPSKLQSQVDFLSKHPDYSLVFHPVRVFFENNEDKESIYPTQKGHFDTEELLKTNFIQTNSVMYRRKDYRHIPRDILPMDWYLHLYHALYGKIGFINKVMSSYRRHSAGIWSDSYQNPDGIWTKHGLEHYSMYCEVFELFKDNIKDRDKIQSSIYRAFGILLDIDRKYNSNIAEEALRKYPERIDPLVISLNDSVTAEEKIALSQQGVIGELSKKVDELSSLLSQKEEELQQIKDSKMWKALKRYRLYKNKLLLKK